MSCESPNAPSSDPADASSQQAGFSLDTRAQELVQALTPEDLPETTVEQTWSHTLDREVLLDALAQGVRWQVRNRRAISWLPSQMTLAGRAALPSTTLTCGTMCGSCSAGRDK